MKSLLQDVDGFEAEIDDLGGGFEFTFAESADEVLDAMCDATEAFKTYLAAEPFTVWMARKSLLISSGL